jgi:NDP-sugar pyrophosphorylase family protein
MRITLSDESGLLLDTGGGIKKASWFFDDDSPFLVHNADILSDIDIKGLYEFHLNNYALATLAVQKRETDRLLLFDEKWQLAGWKNNQTGRIKKINEIPVSYEMGFCGIHIIRPEIFPWIRQEGVFSIIESYLEIARDFPVTGYDIKNVYWTDIGNPHTLEQADRYFSENSL